MIFYWKVYKLSLLVRIEYILAARIRLFFRLEVLELCKKKPR